MLGITQGSQQIGRQAKIKTMKTIKPTMFKPAKIALLSLAIGADPRS
jgi:hypothetical protein